MNCYHSRCYNSPATLNFITPRHSNHSQAIYGVEPLDYSWSEDYNRLYPWNMHQLVNNVIGRGSLQCSTLRPIPLRPASLTDCVSGGGGESSSSVKQERILQMRVRW